MSGKGTVNNPTISGQGYSGQLGLNASTSDYNSILSIIKQVLGETRTVTLVQIVKVTVSDAVGPVGFCDVLPIVNMLDGLGTAYKHSNVFGLCYFRLQGGPNAVIMDPKIGDIGIAVISDRDISTVKKTKKQGNPGSRRRFSLSDGIYLGGVLNGAPTQYVRFLTDPDTGAGNGVEVVDALGNSIKTSTAGINWTDKNSNTIVSNSDGITINGILFDQSQNVSGMQDLTADGGVSLGGGSLPVKLSDGSNATKVRAT